MTKLSRAVRVRVPATTANLGPGFDTLGLALQVYNFIAVEQSESASDEIVATGEGARTLMSGVPHHNIALLAARELLCTLGERGVPLKLSLENTIPLARGLGSSSAARAGALVAANEWARLHLGRSADTSTLLTLATELEGHPDNVAPALLGGLVVSTLCDDGRVLSSRLPVEKFPRLVIFVPDSELETKAARAVLPQSVPLGDATFNISRSSLLVAALVNQEWELLREATRDRLHQSQRAALMPAYNAVAEAALAAGAYGATLSGAGPCILAWLPDESTLVAGAIERMQNAAAEQNVLGAAREVEVETEGCVVV